MSRVPTFVMMVQVRYYGVVSRVPATVIMVHVR